MALSTCPKCNSHSFEMVEHTPNKSDFRLMFVQCSSCGAVVGAMDFYNLGEVLRKQNKAIKKIAQKLEISVDLD